MFGTLLRRCFFVTVSAVAMGAFAASAFALDQTPVRRLVTDDHLKTDVASSGDLIVWRDHGHVLGGPSSIKVFDLTTSAETTLVSGGVNAPAVYGRKIVTSVYSADTARSDVHLYDYDEKSDVVVLSGVEGLQTPGIWKDVIVWKTPAGIFGKHLSSGDEFTVSMSEIDFQPEIAAGWVVFTRQNITTVGDTDIYDDNIMGYEIATGRTVTLCDAEDRQYYPQIGENGVVVWQDMRNAGTTYNMDVYGTSVYDRKEFAVATGPETQSYARVQGNLIVYFDDSEPGGYRVLGLDRLSGTVFGMCSPEYVAYDMTYVACVDNGAVVWTRCKWTPDGNVDGTYTGDIFIAEPARIGVVAGADRFEVAVAASRSSFPEGAARAVVASGMKWPDALAGAGLVGTGAPLLLTAADSLPAVTANELRRLKVTSVDILGGTSSVSTNVEQAIAAIVSQNVAALAPTALAGPVSVGSIRRLAGSDRFASSGSIAEEIMRTPGWDGTVIVASGLGFTDALAASPIAANATLPVMLTGPTGLTAVNVARLRNLGTKRVIIVGGTASVPDAVFKQMVSVVGATNVKRVWGTNRYSTATAVASFGVRDYGLKWNGVGIASGTAFADAMVGGVLKGKQGSVMLLTDGTSLSPATATALKARRSTIRAADCVGGARTVTRTVRGQVRTILR